MYQIIFLCFHNATPNCYFIISATSIFPSKFWKCEDAENPRGRKPTSKHQGEWEIHFLDYNLKQLQGKNSFTCMRDFSRQVYNKLNSNLHFSKKKLATYRFNVFASKSYFQMCLEFKFFYFSFFVIDVLMNMS